MRFAPYLLCIAAGLCVSALLPAPASALEGRASLARDTGLRALGPMRGYASTAVWLRADDAYRRGDLFETQAAYQVILELQPRNPAVYEFLAWNQAFNLAAQFPERARRAEWLVRGFNTLRLGRRRLPDNAGLYLQEWHFLLARSGTFPLEIFADQIPLRDAQDPAWASIARRVLELADALDTRDRETMEHFLDEVGLFVTLFDLAERLFTLPETKRARLLDPAFEDLPPEVQGELGEEFHPLERFQLRELLKLSPAVHEVLAACHWLRLHLMALVVAPALELSPRPPLLEDATLNSARLAWASVPPVVPREQFADWYRQVVAKALRAGIESARRREGAAGATEFIERMRENFADVPELLPEWLPATEGER
jgi:hypothetical protein